ncbi:transcription antiterminator GlcT [Staphylococcus piscifermentans]|uniref:Protein GlcT n=1 Tax=Staphylococcus piscifermentans TaxID=70258 RepID=A0A239U5Y2_9STAP|nr:PRD domain-containing protein [Staphylococcus piscifermentans]RTX86566.1 transcription antiterminator [Staphylococcus piscifermentans]GEP83533.1 protein GlcT [Staphylococcus piscifermentans]SNV04828.1 transcription antiterminator GlcT [Staphylococcus piscifermentans]
MSNYVIEKTLNNNVIICTDEDHHEVVLIGRGIGFNKKRGMKLSDSAMIDKVYKLEQKKEQDHYKALVEIADDKVLQTIIEAMDIITHADHSVADEDLMVALTDHIIFAYKRIQQQQFIKNPFLIETKQLYSESYAIAERVIEHLNRLLDIDFPEDEIGFIALHIASSKDDLSLHEVRLTNEIINKSVLIMEHDLKCRIDTASIQYQRFIRHIQFLIRRLQKGEVIQVKDEFGNMLKAHYPLCYNIAVKIIKMMQQHLDVDVYEAELIYLTLHIYHFTQQNEENMHV